MLYKLMTKSEISWLRDQTRFFDNKEKAADSLRLECAVLAKAGIILAKATFPQPEKHLDGDKVEILKVVGRDDWWPEKKIQDKAGTLAFLADFHS
jgi:hypothetical protein